MSHVQYSRSTSTLYHARENTVTDPCIHDVPFCIYPSYSGRNLYIFITNFLTHTWHGYLSILADFIIVLPSLSSAQEEQKHHLSGWTLLWSCYQQYPASRQGKNSCFSLTNRAVVFADRRSSEVACSNPHWQMSLFLWARSFWGWISF